MALRHGADVSGVSVFAGFDCPFGRHGVFVLYVAEKILSEQQNGAFCVSGVSGSIRRIFRAAGIAVVCGVKR